MIELLDAIAQAAGTPALSDLRTVNEVQTRIPLALRMIPPDAYHLAEWQEAVRYILGESTAVPASELEARALLEQTTNYLSVNRHTS